LISCQEERALLVDIVFVYRDKPIGDFAHARDVRDALSRFWMPLHDIKVYCTKQLALGAECKIIMKGYSLKHEYFSIVVIL
jgi:hypothetical protein